jgi:hypothetical protein
MAEEKEMADGPVLEIWPYADAPAELRELLPDMSGNPRAADVWIAHVPADLADAPLLNLLQSNERAPALATVSLPDGARLILGIAAPHAAQISASAQKARTENATGVP